jgi:branched-chain amino acid transport system ATP-binding protein
MLAIGRALMTNPRLLILDEATEGLAPLVRAEIWQCLATLKRDGLTLVLIDKNIGPMLKLADRHYIVERGRIAWSGDSQALAAAPDVLHRYVGV